MLQPKKSLGNSSEWRLNFLKWKSNFKTLPVLIGIPCFNLHVWTGPIVWKTVICAQNQKIPKFYWPLDTSDIPRPQILNRLNIEEFYLWTFNGFVARDAPDSLSDWWTVNGWSVCIRQIPSVCICFTLSVWIYPRILPQLAGWCKRDGFRNIAEAIASFAKWIVPLFQNCIIIIFKSNTNFRENICFFTIVLLT